jgi:hypothetical protein
VTRTCCPSCRLRFSTATAAHLETCPFCAGPLDQRLPDAVLGFKLMAMDGLAADEPAVAVALAVALPVPTPGARLHE